MNRLRKPSENFTMVPNALIRDGRLSLKAKGVYCILFSKPDGWVYVEPALVEESADGRDAFRAAVKELIETGWLEKRQAQDETGRFSRIDWVLSADGKPVAGKPGDGLSVAGESTPINTDQTKTEGERDIPPVSPLQPERKASRRANSGTSLETYLGGSSDLPAEWWERATKAGLTVADIEREWPNFRDYYLASGKKWLKWELVWDRWCRTSRRPRSPQYLTAGQRNARAALLENAGWAAAAAGSGSGPGHEPAGGPEAESRRF